MALMNQWWVWLAIYVLGLTVGFYILGYVDEDDDYFWPPAIFWPILLPFGLAFLVVYWIARLPLTLGQQHRKTKRGEEMTQPQMQKCLRCQQGKSGTCLHELHENWRHAEDYMAENHIARGV